MQTILEIENVKKKYGKTQVLKGISLKVEEGEIISVLGPSGCGKSTLLRIIAGILPLDGGMVRIRGQEVSGPPPQSSGGEAGHQHGVPGFCPLAPHEGGGQYHLRPEDSENRPGGD